MTRTILLTLLGGALLAALAGCSPLRILNNLNPNGPVDHVSGLSYGPDPRNMLDIYTPKSKPANAPVVVFFMAEAGEGGPGLITRLSGRR